MRLEVRPDNRAAVALYRAAGYERFARIERYYEDGAPAERFRKSLNR
jgi:ribosomal protein S18 acetylase RimI-like enzyme